MRERRLDWIMRPRTHESSQSSTLQGDSDSFEKCGTGELGQDVTDRPDLGPISNETLCETVASSMNTTMKKGRREEGVCGRYMALPPSERHS